MEILEITGIDERAGRRRVVLGLAKKDMECALAAVRACMDRRRASDMRMHADEMRMVYCREAMDEAHALSVLGGTIGEALLKGSALNLSCLQAEMLWDAVHEELSYVRTALRSHGRSFMPDEARMERHLAKLMDSLEPTHSMHWQKLHPKRAMAEAMLDAYWEGCKAAGRLLDGDEAGAICSGMGFPDDVCMLSVHVPMREKDDVLLAIDSCLCAIGRGLLHGIAADGVWVEKGEMSISLPPIADELSRCPCAGSTARMHVRDYEILSHVADEWRSIASDVD